MFGTDPGPKQACDVTYLQKSSKLTHTTHISLQVFVTQIL